MQAALLIAAGVVFVAAFVLRSTQPDKAALAWGAFGVGVVLAVVAVIAPRFSSSDITIAIVAPDEGAAVAAGKPLKVDVKVTGAKVAKSATDLNGGHIHIYVDGNLELMASATSGTIKLEPGTHKITAEYVSPDHLALDPPIRESVEVTAKK